MSIDATDLIPEIYSPDIVSNSCSFSTTQPTLMRPSAVSAPAADSVPVFAIDREDVRRLSLLR